MDKKITFLCCSTDYILNENIRDLITCFNNNWTRSRRNMPLCRINVNDKSTANPTVQLFSLAVDVYNLYLLFDKTHIQTFIFIAAVLAICGAIYTFLLDVFKEFSGWLIFARVIIIIDFSCRTNLISLDLK